MTPTIVQRACAEVQGFQNQILRLEKRIVVSGKSMSTLHNYTRCIAHLSLHFQLLPTALTQGQVEDYLFQLKKRGAAESFFKHTVYGLRFLFRVEGLPYRAIQLPQLKATQRLPVVLSRAEVQQLLQVPMPIKHRLIIAILYGCGLRCQELRGLQIRDVDFERNLIYVRHGKGKKDRYVPLGQALAHEIKAYLLRCKPVKWLFNGKNYNGYSPQGVQRAIREAQRKTTILKRLSPHTLRHTYATHLLEQGLDIVSIKELLGHAHIQTTMVYLHVGFTRKMMAFSPFDTLFERPGELGNSGDCFQYERQYYHHILQKRAANRQARVTTPSRQFEFCFDATKQAPSDGFN